MKTNTKSIPKDELSVEEDGRSIHIFTHRNQIGFSTRDAWGNFAANEYLTFSELWDAIQGLQKPSPLSSPSPAKKRAARATSRRKKGGVA